MANKTCISTLNSQDLQHYPTRPFKLIVKLKSFEELVDIYFAPLVAAKIEEVY
jgi:hypothetical protein